jgi:hypothetical protein
MFFIAVQVVLRENEIELEHFPELSKKHFKNKIYIFIYCK